LPSGPSPGWPDDLRRVLAVGEVLADGAGVALPAPAAVHSTALFAVPHYTQLAINLVSGGAVDAIVNWSMDSSALVSAGTTTLSFDGTGAVPQNATVQGHLASVDFLAAGAGQSLDFYVVGANPFKAACVVTRNLFPCRVAAEGGAGDLVWGGRTATYVADAAASDGTALEFAAVAANWAALIAGITVDEYNISPFFKPSPAPFSTDPPFTPFAAYFYACLLRVRARITVAGATYKLTVSAADNVVPPGSAISIARADTFDVTDQGVRELPGGNFSATEDPVTRAIASLTFQNYDFYLTQVPTVVTAGGPQVLIYGWKTAGAGFVHVDTVDFRWARVALT
jgi:hypothetical protein